jgi:TldD protein
LSFTRRDFLRASAVGAAGLATGCVVSYEHTELAYPVYLDAELADATFSAARTAGASHADLRLVGQRIERVSAHDERVQLSTHYTFGAGVRVWIDGRLGTAAGTDLSRMRMETLVKKAAALADVARGAGRPVPPPSSTKARWETPVEVDAFGVTREQKVGDCLAAVAAARAVPWITSASATLACVREERFFASMTGAEIKQVLVRTEPRLRLRAQGGESCLEAARDASAGCGYEAARGLDAMARALADDAVARAGGRPAAAGRYDLILMPAPLALLLEAIARASGRGNARPGSPLVELGADRTRPRALATVGYDDDGVPASAWTLLRGGEVVPPSPPQCLAHGDGWWGSVRSCAPNLTLAAGTATLAELIAGTPHGILIDGDASVLVGAQGQVRIAGGAWREIVEGKPAGFLRGGACIVPLASLWQRCDAVAAEDAREVRPVSRAVASVACVPVRFRGVAVTGEGGDA